LEIRPGVTAVIGGGGKTTLLRTLGEELAREHTVLLCTTTKILPFPGLPCARTGEELDGLRQTCRLLCAGAPVPGTEKLGPLEIPMAQLAGWFDYVLVEADGAARRPIKAHAPHEPVIPAETGQTILVVGASGFGHPIAQAAHRPALYARLADVSEADPVTPAAEAAVILAEGLQDRFFINQVESEQDRENALALANWLDGPVVIGSLWKETYFSCSL
jgi:probable selenium-dependent hydroxylase accessory protein YqeC